MSIFNMVYGKKQNRWKPGANTIAYYPLTSTTTVNDMSGNNYHLTNSGNVSFGDIYGVDGAYFNAKLGITASCGLYRTTDNIINTGQDYTFSVWLWKQNSNMRYSPRIIGRYNTSLFTYTDRQKISVISTTYGVVPDTQQWFLFTCTYNSSTKDFVYYKNGVYQNTQNDGSAISSNIGGLVLGTRDNLGTQDGDKRDGGMREIIIENRIWTAQEIQDYYNQTKAEYGL